MKASSINGVHVFFTTTRDGAMTEFKNRRRFLAEQGLSDFMDATMHQVHGCNIEIVGSDYENGTKADALVTNRSQTALFSKAADCPSVLFFDPVLRVIAAAHCGWRGTYAGLSAKTIKVMIERFGSDPKDIVVTIGPGIGICCFQVEPEVACYFEQNFGSELVKDRYVDLQGINLRQLVNAGLLYINIKIIKRCTCCDENYFSYQRMGKDFYKNFAGIIALR